MYVHVYQYLHTGTSHRFQSRFYFLDKFELNWTMITIRCLLIYSLAIWGKTVENNESTHSISLESQKICEVI